MSKTTLYQKTRLGKLQQWSIWVEDNGKSGHPEVWIEHGLSDGKKQLTYDVVKEGVNQGKANETSPLQQAGLMMERRITKQKEHGYSEDPDNALEDKSISFREPLPKELCFYKPKNSIEDNKIKTLEKANRAIYTVKRDGMMHVVRRSRRYEAEIYTRTMDLVTDKYPHLKEAFWELADGTVILGEIILDKDGKDDFNGVSSICRSDPEEAIVKQKELGNVSYYAFDLAFYGGENKLTSWTYKRRLQKLKEIITNDIKSSYVKVVETINKPHKQALKEVQNRKLEGLVVWDAEGMMEAKGAYTFNGKAYRPNVLWKSKPKYEDDFIVRWDPENGIGEYGNGKNRDKIRSAAVYQLDDSGKEVYLGNCGGGLSDDQKNFYTNRALFPRVWRIEYDSIQPKTGALRFPVFNADRTLIGDKKINECLLSDAVKSAQAQEEDENE